MAKKEVHQANPKTAFQNQLMFKHFLQVQAKILIEASSNIHHIFPLSISEYGNRSDNNFNNISKKY